MDLTALTSTAARAVLLEKMGLCSDASRATIAAELLRAALWALSAPLEDERFREVHVHRLINLALESSTSVLTPEDDEAGLRTDLRSALEKLVEAGDIYHQGKGRYLPGSCRLVRVDGGNLLVGGLPSALLPSSALEALESRGVLRRLRIAGVEGLPMPEESLSAWAHIPAEPLEEWGNRLCAQDTDPFESDQESTQIEVYAPNALPAATSQWRRWGTARIAIPDGRYLGRWRRAFGAIEHCVAELKGGTVVRVGGAFLPGEPKRFMFYLDSRARRPLQVELRRTGDVLEVILPGSLPLAEWRLFSALGDWDLEHRVWRFSRLSDHHHVIEALRRLRIGDDSLSRRLQ